MVTSSLHPWGVTKEARTIVPTATFPAVRRVIKEKLARMFAADLLSIPLLL